jgi:hypothetical protein
LPVLSGDGLVTCGRGGGVSLKTQDAFIGRIGDGRDVAAWGFVKALVPLERRPWQSGCLWRLGYDESRVSHGDDNGERVGRVTTRIALSGVWIDGWLIGYYTVAAVTRQSTLTAIAAQ